jgi:hypothetical protein
MEVICNHGRKNKGLQAKIMRIAHDWINVNLRSILVAETMIASPDYMCGGCTNAVADLPGDSAGRSADLSISPFLISTTEQQEQQEQQEQHHDTEYREINLIHTGYRTDSLYGAWCCPR